MNHFIKNKMKLAAVFSLFLLFLSLYHCKKCQCGQKLRLKSNARIFNGQSVEVDDDEQFPYYVYIQFNAESKEVNDYEWGGALISKRHILTCAHGFFPTGNETSIR